MRKVDTLSAPIRLAISIGGFTGSRYEARWSRGRLWYRGVDGSRVKVIPSSEAWGVFWAGVDRIGVWGWQAHYDDLAVMDGTQWSVDLSDGSRHVRCTGSNAYPQRFEEFLETVGALEIGRAHV